MVSDDKGVVLEVNRVAERIAGCGRADLLGNNIDELLKKTDAYDADDSAESTRVLVTKNGEAVIVAMTSFSLRSDNGSLSLICHIFRDITVRFKMEQERNLNLAMFAHDIKNPANASLQLVGRLLAGQVGQFTEKQLCYLHILQTGLEKIAQLSEDLIVFAKIEMGEFTLCLRPYDFVAALHAAVEAFRLEAEQKNILVTVRIDSNYTKNPCADGVMLNRVLANIIGNSIKYSRSGGEVRIKLSSNGCRVRCSVADNGIGIPADTAVNVFTPFFRGSEANTPGTGLGLAIVKSIIESHGGKIRLRSKPGRGTVASFMLPLVPE